MPATEETYRPQPTLHIVFAVSSIAMLLSIVWMILADHLRPWKQVQREFHRVEDAKLRVAEEQEVQKQEAKNKAAIAEVEKQIARARQMEYANARQIYDVDQKIKGAQGRVDHLDTRRRFTKAELDSQRSFYDGMIDRDEVAQANRYLNTVIIPGEQKYEEISRQYEAADRELKQL